MTRSKKQTAYYRQISGGVGLLDLARLPSITPEVLLGSTPLPRTSQPVRFSLGKAPARERAGLLQDCFTRLGFTYQVDPLRDVPIVADVVLQALPGLRMTMGRMHGTRNRRTRALVDGTDDIGLVLNLRGPHLIAQGNSEVLLDDGEATFLSSLDPCSLSHRPPGDVVTLRFPRARFAPMVAGLQDLMLRRIPRDNPALGLLRHYLSILWDDRNASPELQHLMVSHMHDLAAVMIGATRDAEQVALGRGVATARLHAIKQDIARNVHRADLSVAMLADRHRCTPRLVQRLFEAEGTTFTQYVLGQRLALAHRLLLDPRRDADKVSAVAYACGFGDLSYFNRAFRRHYGAAPSEVRAQARLERPGAGR
jgi:AraC-like DNA-binding protein